MKKLTTFALETRKAKQKHKTQTKTTTLEKKTKTQGQEEKYPQKTYQHRQHQWQKQMLKTQQHKHLTNTQKYTTFAIRKGQVKHNIAQKQQPLKNKNFRGKEKNVPKKNITHNKNSNK